MAMTRLLTDPARCCRATSDQRQHLLRRNDVCMAIRKTLNSFMLAAPPLNKQTSQEGMPRQFGMQEARVRLWSSATYPRHWHLLSTATRPAKVVRIVEAVGGRGTFMSNMASWRILSAIAKLQWTTAAEIQEATWPYHALAALIVVLLIIFVTSCAYNLVLLVYCILRNLYQVVDFAGGTIGLDILPDLEEEEDNDEQQRSLFGCC
eukprot:TRINITY_DN10457_c0_g1_i1.p2 TRINITY_DN10457_c0_g1~~TRINITY_DN10457_c0_g1_i1.p2  ORF type:complete len:206 (+),score=24.39 TRINITY_DN10457_c0_g1_i1:183-800(+)